jgi:hypothetical protein
MAFSTGVTGGYNSTTNLLTISAFPSNSLEIGSEHGPGGVGIHYGTGGTLGGPFMATLNVSVTVQDDGSVTPGGTVTIIFDGSAPGSIGDDYGIVPTTPLLLGSVLEVLLDESGDNTLGILFTVTGGALQTDNPDPDVGVFAPFNQGLIRLTGTLPSDFTSDFSVTGATVDVLGTVPELSFTTLVVFGSIFVWISGSRRWISLQREE